MDSNVICGVGGKWLDLVQDQSNKTPTKTAKSLFIVQT